MFALRLAPIVCNHCFYFQSKIKPDFKCVFTVIFKKLSFPFSGNFSV